MVPGMVRSFSGLDHAASLHAEHRCGEVVSTIAALRGVTEI